MEQPCSAEPAARILDVGCGTVFRFNPKTGKKLTTVYTFKGGKDGARPRAGLINVDGTLYGVTEEGGPVNYGTVFAITP